MPFTFAIGEEFRYQGIEFEVFDYKPSQESFVIKALRKNDRKVIELVLNDIIQDSSFERITGNKQPEDRSIPSDISAFPEKLRTEAERRYALLKPIILLNEAKQGDDYAEFLFKKRFTNLLSEEGEPINKTEIVAILSKEKNICERTIWRWLDEYEGKGLYGLLPHNRRITDTKITKFVRIVHPQTKDTLQTIPVRNKSEEQIKIIEESIRQSYLCRVRPSISNVVQEINDKLVLKNLAVISSRSLYSLIKQIDPKIVTRYREGEKKFRDTYASVTAGVSNQSADYPLQVVQVDHTVLDIILVDHNGKKVGRPTLTLAMDVFTRLPWGMDLSFGSPSSLKVKELILHGLRPKNCRGKIPDLTHEWILFGVPERFVVDNGSDFTSKEVRRCIEEVLRSDLQFCPVARPEFKGVVERMFGTLNTKLIHTIPGTTKSNTRERGDYKAEKEACLTIEELREMIVIYLTDIYPLDIHKGLPPNANTPLLRYNQGINKVGMPRMVDDKEYQRLLFELLTEGTVKVGKEGIKSKNITYQGQALSPYVNDKKNHRVKWDESDVSHCYFLDDINDKWVEIFAVSPLFETVKGLSILEWSNLQRQWDEDSRTGMADLNILDNRPEARSLMGKILSEARKTQKENLKNLAKNDELKNSKLLTGFEPQNLGIFGDKEKSSEEMLNELIESSMED